MSLLAAAALAAALGATGHLDLELRTEARGLRGRSETTRSFEPVPFEVAPRVGFWLESDPRLRLSLGLTPRLLLLAPDTGGYRVHSVAEQLGGNAAVAWRPNERLALGLSGSAARGTEVTSPLAQLSATAAPTDGVTQPGQPGPPGALPLGPGGGVRTGLAATVSALAGFDWRATRTLSFGGSTGYSRTGGIGEANRLLFPLREGPTADLHVEHAATALDSVWLGASYAQATMGASDRIATLGLGTRWDRRLGTDSSTSLSAGVAATLEETAVIERTSSALDRLSPTVGAAYRKAPPAGGQGVGIGVSAAYGPYADRFFNRVRQRVSGLADLVWTPTTATQFSLIFSGATALGAGQTGPTVAAAELAVARRHARAEIGLHLRGGYQEGEAPFPDIWQWGLGVTARWGERFAW